TDQLILENNLTNGSSFSLPVIASGKGPLVVTLSWTDPAGKVDEVNLLNNPARKLVNDLDLRVIGNSTTYTPWILNRKNPGNAATNGDDTLNNLEKIQISNAIPGKTYTLQVTHKGTLQKGAQAYSLIASGVGGQNYCSSAATSSAGTRIDQVIIDNDSNIVTNPPGCTTYTDYTNKTIHLQSSRAASFAVKLSSCDASTAQRVVKVYIDYNNNGSFTDSGEMVLVSPVLSGGSITYSSGAIPVPEGLKTGSSTLLRIVVQETTDTSAVHPCGSYGNGETEDYRVQFVAPSNDVALSGIVDPLPSFCQADSERISVRIKNAGTSGQENFPVSLRVSSGGITLVDVSTIYPDTVLANGNSTYTFQPTFNAEAGKTYIVTASTKLANDQDTTNNTITDTLTVGSGSATSVTGDAEICSTNPPQAGLKANVSDSSDAILWYESQTATTPLAAGVQATTSVIPSDKTYYLGVNDLNTSVGPKSKMEFASGGYNFFQGNFIRFSNKVPLTITSSRLYVGNGGKVTFIVADLASFDSCTGAYSYYPISSNTIDVYPTTPNPQAGAVTGNSASDTGAVFLLNLSVPTPGNHVLIIVADNGATLFRNNNITSNNYPFGIPGVFSITGNSAIDQANCKDTTFYQSYYYFLYDLRLTLNKCPSPRIPVLAKTPTAAVITLAGNLLSSNYSSGNQWYFNDTLIAGATGPTDSAFIPGVYKDVVFDSLGCSLVSNEISYSLGSDIGLKTTPNPNNGTFHLQFYVAQSANTGVSVVNALGQKIYEADYPAFGGFFSKTISLGPVSAGMYVLKVQIGGKKYVRKIMVY
ncbi:MAG: GEVED domain-containing protein, partial [Bacteroidota bacterium]|nr:GEVED domain-containing protein [Bacteroidota bacterium]